MDDPVVLGPNDEYICATVYDMQSTTIRDSVDADGLLIAAAPALLAALENMVKSLNRAPYTEDPETLREIYIQAQQAIAQAKGE